jgi:hypothetical protein
VIVRRALAADAEAAADLAEAKRAEYAAYSPVFWRPAAGARERHRPFLAHCIENDRFLALAAEDAGELAGLVLAGKHGAPPPFHADAEPTWFVDDFLVAGGDWDGAGALLLERVAGEAGGARLVVVTAHADRPKCAFLEARGFACAASWWVLPVDAEPGDPVLPDGAEAVTGPAPPVYDPGGLTALALRLDPRHVADFVAWTVASDAVLAIVAARESDTSLAAALAAAGFARASAWYVRGI